MHPVQIDPALQNFINDLYARLRPRLKPEYIGTLESVCRVVQTPVELQSELYRLLNPFLADDVRALFIGICNAHAAAQQGLMPMAQANANPFPAPNPPAPTPNPPSSSPPPDCPGAYWTGTGWACPMPKPGGGGCGCGGQKHPHPHAPNPHPPPAPTPKPIPQFSNGCYFPCPPPAVQASPTTSPATNPYVNMNGGINCLWYDQALTLCEIRKIKETEQQTSNAVEAVLTDPNTYEFDLPPVGVASGLCLLSFRLWSLDKTEEYTELVGAIEIRQVKQVQSPIGESLLVYGDIKSAAGSRLTTNNGRCECTQLCVCQPATLPVRVVISVDVPLDPASILVEYDAERLWADDACIQCFECGIPQQCGEDPYVPLP